MKKVILSTVFVLLAVLTQSQNFSFELGSPIEHEGYVDIAVKQFESNNNRNLKGFKRWKLLGFHNDHYFLIKRNEKIRELYIFDSKFSLVDHVDIHIMQAHKDLEFENGVLINDKVTLFYRGSTEDLGKDFVGLYAWEMSTSEFKFTVPTLIAKYEKSDDYKYADFKMSDNGEYFNFIVHKHFLLSKKFEGHQLTFDKDLNVLVNKTLNFETADPTVYQESIVLDNGDCIIQLKDKPLVKVSGLVKFPFAMPMKRVYLVKCNSQGAETNVISLEDRNILDVKIKGNNEYFVTWCNANDKKLVGLSEYSLSDKKERKIHTFSADWIEPFLELKKGMGGAYSYTKDALPSKNLAKNQSNVLFEVDYTYVAPNGDITYVIVKKTEYLMVNNNTRASYYGVNSGDIMFLTFDKTGTLKFKQKIERCMEAISFNNVHHFMKDDQIHSLYYNNAPDEDYKLKMGFKNVYNTYLYHSVYSFKEGSLDENIEIRNTVKGDFHYFFYLNGNLRQENSITGVALGEDTECLYKINFE